MDSGIIGAASPKFCLYDVVEKLVEAANVSVGHHGSRLKNGDAAPIIPESLPYDLAGITFVLVAGSSMAPV